jgi:methylenetetrahydrofolate dehydrogenase (NAD+)
MHTLTLPTSRNELKKTIKERGIRPKLVGFLANSDPAAAKYAEWTDKTCQETGIEFELRVCSRNELEEKIVEANQDDDVHGIMVYYPVFGDRQVKN